MLGGPDIASQSERIEMYEVHRLTVDHVARMFEQLSRFDDTPWVRCPDGPPRSGSGERDWRGPLSHRQFEYDRARAVFGNRAGWGPLVITPDTNILIDLVDAFDSVESHFGVAGPLPLGDRGICIDSLRELFALWFHRNVRWSVSDLYLADSRGKPLSAERRERRVKVLEALTADMRDRGGLERGIAWWELDGHEREMIEGWITDDERARQLATGFALEVKRILDGIDGALVADALRLGSHVFLTEDRGILRKSRLLYGWGLSVLRPCELLELLDAAGELGEGGIGASGYELAPDLLSLARFYAIAE